MKYTILLFGLSAISCALAKKCPSTDGVFAVLYEHESDSSKYYHCSHGSAILMHCPPNLVFNPVLSVCDYAENPNPAPEIDPSPEVDPAPEVEPSPEVDPAPEVDPLPEVGDIECPAEQGDDVVLFPHPRDCTKFYKCDYGVPYLKECPEGLAYSPEYRTCDFRENVDC